MLLSSGWPNCVHTTWASVTSHPLLHIEPHTLLTHISTLPSFSIIPSANLIAPLVLHSVGSIH